MALPPAEIGGKPWYEERASWWSSLGARGQGLFILGLVFVAIWVAEAALPALGLEQSVAICSRYSCLSFPSDEFALGEALLALAFLAPAAGAFAGAIREARRNAG